MSGAASDDAGRAARTPVAALVELLGTTPWGLSSAEAVSRLAVHGPNRLETGTRSIWSIAREQVATGINALMAAAALLTAAVGSAADGVIILSLLAISVLVGFLQEVHAERALSRLNTLLTLRTRGWRDGAETTLALPDLVPGDLVSVRAGDVVPADLRVVEAVGLEVNEAALTGQARPQPKGPAPVTSPDPARWTSILFAGTAVTGGQGRGIVIATGRATHYGATAALSGLARTPSIFQAHLTRFARVLVRAAFGLAAVIFAANAIAGRGVVESLTLAVALALGTVPEALPAVTATTLALGAARLAQRKVLVRRLSSVEDLSVVDTLCIGSTGTMTENGTGPAGVRTWMSAADRLGPALARSSAGGAVEVSCAVAEQAVGGEPSCPGEPAPADLGAVGPLALRDLTRSGARAALARIESLHVEERILTADTSSRGAALARDLGWSVPPDALVSARGLGPDQLPALADRGRILCEVTPAGKRSVVEALRGSGRHVAVTGDGVTDAPALRAADVGIALAGSSDAARTAAGLILLEDDLDVIADGIEEGRRTVTNLNRYLLYTMLSNFANVLVIALGSLLLGFLPLRPAQVLLLTLLPDLPMLLVVTDRVAGRELASPGRWNVARVMGPAFVFGAVNAAFAFGLLGVLVHQPAAIVQSAWFLFLGTTALLVYLAVRHRGWAWEPPLPSPILLTAIAAALLATFGVVDLPPCRRLLGFAALPWQAQLAIIGWSVGFVLLVDALTHLQGAHHRPRPAPV
jgi:H+-transporting ATPase